MEWIDSVIDLVRD